MHLEDYTCFYLYLRGVGTRVPRLFRYRLSRRFTVQRGLRPARERLFSLPNPVFGPSVRQPPTRSVCASPRRGRRTPPSAGRTHPRSDVFPRTCRSRVRIPSPPRRTRVSSSRARLPSGALNPKTYRRPHARAHAPFRRLPSRRMSTRRRSRRSSRPSPASLAPRPRARAI